MAVQTVRVSYSMLKKMLSILDKTNLIDGDEDKMNLLVSYESVSGLGANIDMTVEDTTVGDEPANVTFSICGVADW